MYSSHHQELSVNTSPPIPGLAGLKLMGSQSSLFRFFGDPVPTLQSIYRQHGRIGAVIAGDSSLVCAFGAEYNQRILSDANRFYNFAELPFPIPPDSAAAHLNIALTAMNGEHHRRSRRLMMPAFSKATIASYRDEMVSIAERHLAGWPKDGEINLSAEMVELTLLVAMNCLFGLDALDEAEMLGHMGMRYLSSITSLGVMLFPVNLPGTPYAHFMKFAEVFKEKLLEMIRQRRAAASRRQDVLSLMIASRDEDGSSFSDEELIGQTSLIFLAGHETTAFTLSWTLFLLSQHPQIYAAVLDELDAELHGDAPTVEQIERLPLLENVIKESMRLLPATPFFFVRQGMADFELGPYRLPQGAKVVLSPLITHRLPEIYTDPNRFLPERWNQIKPTTFEYLPFGAGPRMCLGSGFAALEVRLVLAMIVQRFRLSLLPGMNVSYKVQGITMGPKFGLPMHVSGHDRAFAPPTTVKGNIHQLIDLTA